MLEAFNKVFYKPDSKKAAEKTIKKTIKLYGSITNYKQKVWGAQIKDPQKVKDRADAYIRTHQIKGAKTKLSSTTLVTTMGQGTFNLVATPGYYRKLRLESLLDHELSVHHIRSWNHKSCATAVRKKLKQGRKERSRELLGEDEPKFANPMHQKIMKSLAKHMVTVHEEGLASLVTHAHYIECPLLYQPALSNYIVHLAQQYSFYECFARVRAFCVDDKDCWIQVLRSKRGLADTSQKGGFVKDLLPFCGCLEVLKALHDGMDLRLFFTAKLRVEEYAELKDYLTTRWKEQGEQLVLPHFLATDKAAAEFMNRMRNIALWTE